ncbi:hypothetical protein ACIGDI_39400 [Streptomyces sp. NPDC085900]|uniref:hypothetical protein n=1 Tax=Streptomyces sp. NPDC085900 TaxID=3365737 RepID=UPI0037D326E7
MANLLREWLDTAQLRLDDVMERLTPEHFSNGRVPSRSTIGERLAGRLLDDEFVQAIADICSGEDAALRERMLVEARALAARQDSTSPDKSPDPKLNPTALANELVAVQRHSLTLQDKLMRAWERAIELDRERSRSHQMVMVLLAMVDKLQRDITTLHAERDRLKGREHRPQRLKQVYQQLARSEEQRQSAETELDRAREERAKADRLAEEAAEQIRTLQAELERLRQRTGQPDNPPPLKAPSLPTSDDTGFDAAAGDIDDALAKASRHLDDGARRLDQLASELHQDDPSDNSAATAETDGTAGQPQADRYTETLTLDILTTVRAMKEHGSPFVSFALEASPELFVGVMGVLLRSDDNQQDWNLAHELLDTAGTRGRPSHLCNLLAELRTYGKSGHSYAYKLLSTVAAIRAPSELVDIVNALRACQQDADAYQLLNAVARSAPAWFISPIALKLSHTDATWLIKAVTNERQEEDILMARKMLERGDHQQYVELLAAPQDRKQPQTCYTAPAPTPPAFADA